MGKILRNTYSKTLPTALFLIFAMLGVVPLISCGGTGDIPTASMAEGGKVELSWKEIPGAIAYNIYMSKTPGVNKLSGYRIAAASNAITITGLENGSTYYFVVTVEDASGEGRESNEVSYTATPNETGSIRLNPVYDPSGAATSQSKNIGQETRTDGGKVVRNPVGEQSGQDPQTKTQAKPTGKMTVAWEEVPHASSYNIYWSTRRGVTKQTGKKISGVQSPYTFTGLKRGATYYFVVTAVGRTGESQESEELSFSVPE